MNINPEHGYAVYLMICIIIMRTIAKIMDGTIVFASTFGKMQILTMLQTYFPVSKTSSVSPPFPSTQVYQFWNYVMMSSINKNKTIDSLGGRYFCQRNYGIINR